MTDKAPYDFGLFPKLKLQLKGRCFSTTEAIQTELQAVIDTFTEADFQKNVRGVEETLVLVHMCGWGLLWRRQQPGCVKLRIHECAKRYANQMHVCVDGTANLRCAIREWFTFCSARTKICQYFCANAKRTGCASMHRVSFARLRFVKLINRAPFTRRTRMAQRVSSALVYTKV